MEPLYLTDKNGKFREHRIIKGKEMIVTEDQLNFHTKRRQARKIIDIVEIPEEVVSAPTIVLDEEPVVVEEKLQALQETPAVKVNEIDEQATKRKPRRRRKNVQTTEE
jgi:hypothetical protein